jgi:DNA end-binding protein Ku
MAETQELERLSKDELYQLAQKQDITGRSNMDKEQLIAALGDGADGGNGAAPSKDRPSKRSKTSNRAIWKGSITFGLITIPVGLYTATEDRDISFHLLSAEDGSRIRYRRVATGSGEEVDWDDIVKGYELDDGQYVTFTHEELEQIPSDSLRAIDVAQFVDHDQIDPISFERSYYVAPEKGGVKAYRLLVRALEESGRVGVAKVTIREKEHLCELRPADGILVLETMQWPDEVRIPDFDQLDESVEIRPEELAMAEELIDRMTSDYDPGRFQDTYRLRLQEAIEAKVKGEEIQLSGAVEEPSKVTDLLEALKASVEATKSRKSA